MIYFFAQFPNNIRREKKKKKKQNKNWQYLPNIARMAFLTMCIDRGFDKDNYNYHSNFDFVTLSKVKRWFYHYQIGRTYC